MQGDLTRNTFDPVNHYSRVVMQEGRVFLDADWNEQTSIHLHLMRTLARDIFGPYAGPQEGLGFGIITKDMDPKIKIDMLGFLLKTGRIDETRAKILDKAIEDGDVLICPGRYYVDGVLVENHHPILYSEQLAYRFTDEFEPEKLFPRGVEAGWLLYLDVWERHITYLWDDHIREVALGGPDTCSRAQVFWQLRVLTKTTKDIDCSSVSSLYRTEYGKLRARTDPGSQSSELCVIAPDSRYRGPENQLYRVEIHQKGKSNEATFKWSRTNGSVVFPIRTLKGNGGTKSYSVALHSLGPDRRLTLNSGDWVEIFDEETIARDIPGVLARVEKQPNRDDLTVTLTTPVSVKLRPYGENDSARPMLRRWDHRGDPAKGGALAITTAPNTSAGELAGWIDLEDGVQIWFSPSEDYRTGDYWLVPARTATGDVDWPYEVDFDGAANDKKIPAALPPRGPRHRYAPIFLWAHGTTGTSSQIQDCRRFFVPSIRAASYMYGFGDQGIGSDF